MHLSVIDTFTMYTLVTVIYIGYTLLESFVSFYILPKNYTNAT